MTHEVPVEAVKIVEVPVERVVERSIEVPREVLREVPVEVLVFASASTCVCGPWLSHWSL